MIRAALLGAVILLCGCGNAPQTYRDLDQLSSDYRRQSNVNGADTCGLGANRTLLGRPSASIDPASLPQGARIVCLNCPVTMDHAPERLNLMLDGDGTVASLRCG